MPCAGLPAARCEGAATPSLLAIEARAVRTLPPVKFSLPVLVADEILYVKEAMLGGHVHGDGPFTARCSAFLERTLATAYLTDPAHGDTISPDGLADLIWSVAMLPEFQLIL